MSGKRSRDKGARGERAVVAHLRSNGFEDARRYLAGDGRQPGDIDWGRPLPVALEVKDCKDYHISAWLRQAVAEAGHRLPVVVMHPRGVADVGDWWAVLRFDDLLGLLRD